MNSIDVATALYKTLSGDTDTDGDPDTLPAPVQYTDKENMKQDVPIYSGVAKRDAEYPFVTIMPVDDVPRHFHRPTSEHQADVVSFQTWDLKIWGKSMEAVTEIYDQIVEILKSDISTDVAASLRGRGMPLMAEENRPNEILYSRVIECEVIF